MAIYEDFDLDITTGNTNTVNANNDWPTTWTTKGDTCECTGDTCTGMSPRPCDR